MILRLTVGQDQTSESLSDPDWNGLRIRDLRCIVS